MATLAGRVVEGLRVVSDALIPDKNGAGFIADATLEVLALSDMVEEEAEEVVGLFLIETNCVMLALKRTRSGLPVEVTHRSSWCRPD